MAAKGRERMPHHGGRETCGSTVWLAEERVPTGRLLTPRGLLCQGGNSVG